MKWILVKDCIFHDNSTQTFITIPKDSIFYDVPHKDQTAEIKRGYSSSTKYSRNLNTKFIVLNCNGKQRIFEIGKSVIRAQTQKIRRIKRKWKTT